MLKSARKKLQHHKIIRASKDIATAALWLDYAEEAIINGKFPSPIDQVNVSEAYVLRNKIGEDGLSEVEILQELNLLEEKATIIKEKANRKNVNYNKLSCEVKSILSAKFVKAMG